MTWTNVDLSSNVYSDIHLKHKNSHLRMADTTAAWTRKGRISEWEEVENDDYNKTQDLCRVSQNLHLTSILDWWVDVRKICMVPGVCDGYWPLCCCWRWWLYIPIIFTYFEKEKFTKIFCGDDKTRNKLINICLALHLYQLEDHFNLKNKLIRSSTIELVRDLKAMNVLAKFEFGPR